jgi:5-oxopent-3-ene-1,2,5-tricarboxylate decarboxylase / 2-hydroxyhepta-2,4-diene-1,7-dioate isomerase
MQALPPSFDARFEFAPWRLSGVVYGTLLNDPAALTALGDAVNAPPYKAPPHAPVLYLKPRNTLAGSGASVAVPTDAGEFEIGASLALVIGRTACRVSVDDAMSHVAGFTLVADLSVPHDNFYRPNVRFKARDGSCIVGPRVVPRTALTDPSALVLQISIDGAPRHAARMANMQRPAAELLRDVTEFMTLRPGDVLMLGVAFGAPRARAGQAFTVECAGIGRLQGRLVAEPQVATT